MRTDALQACDEMNGADVGGQKIVANFQWTDAYKRPPVAGEEELLTQATVPTGGEYNSYERVPHRMHSRNHHHGRQGPHVGSSYPPAPHSGAPSPSYHHGHRGGHLPYHGMHSTVIHLLVLFLSLFFSLSLILCLVFSCASLALFHIEHFSLCVVYML
jgi:hypothetical protein